MTGGDYIFVVVVVIDKMKFGLELSKFFRGSFYHNISTTSTNVVVVETR